MKKLKFYATLILSVALKGVAVLLAAEIVDWNAITTPPIMLALLLGLISEALSIINPSVQDAHNGE
jgi:hypothetical protein